VPSKTQPLWYAASQTSYVMNTTTCESGCVRIYNSPDGINWKLISNNTPVYYSGLEHPFYFTMTDLFIIKDNENVYTSPNCSTWTLTFECTYWNLYSITSLEVMSDGLLILTGTGREDNMIFTSSDAMTWTRILTNETSAPTGLNYIFPVNVGESTDYLLATNSEKLWVSTDGGINWSNSSLSLTTTFEQTAYWLSNDKNVCWFGANFTCAPISKNLINADQWTTALMPGFTELLGTPIILQGQFVAVSSSLPGETATSPTGMSDSWIVTYNQYAGFLNSFYSDQKVMIGVGDSGLLTSTMFVPS